MISREFIKDFLVYSLGSVVAQLSNICLMLFLMYHLPADQVGLLSLSFSTILLLSTVISFGLRQLFMIEFFNLSPKEKKEFVNDSIGVYLLISGIFFVCAAWGYPLFNNYLFAGRATQLMYVSVMVLTFLTFFTELFFQALMYTLQSFKVTFIKSVSAFFIFGLSFIAVYIFKAGIEIVIFAQLLSYFLIVFYAAQLYYSKGLLTYFDASRTVSKSWQLLYKSAPLMPTVFAGLLLASGNRWVLAWHTDLADIAVYSLAEYVSPLFNLLILYPLSGAYLPRAMQQFAATKNIINTERMNKKIMWLSMAALFILGASGYLLLRPLAFYFLPQNYYAAIPGAFIIFGANILLMGTYFSSAILIFKKKSYYLLATMAAAAVVNSALSTLWVPYYGIYGCFTSYAVAYGVYFTLIYYCNRAVVRALRLHALTQADSLKRPAYQAATLLQEEVQELSNNKKESSNELEDRNF